MLTIQERFERAGGDLHKSLDRLCRAIGSSDAAAPTETQLDDLVRQIESCNATADTLATPPVAKAPEAPAAKRQKRKASR